MRSHENANLNLVVFVSSQKRSERIARLNTLGQRRIEPGLKIKRTIGASDV